jgi:hypothetical protein
VDSVRHPNGRISSEIGWEGRAALVDVFVSYKQEERDAVQIIASSLADLKLDVWFDTKLRAGGSFDEEIAAALRATKAVLVCWTPAAIHSEWVRGEATEGLNKDQLAACFLQPTELIPPFNLTHAENLSAWAGQTEDPAWIKLLERIGELVGRSGLATYHAVMRAGASMQEMKDWAKANGADPLVDTVWARIAVLEGEGAEARLSREKAEARVAAEKRKAQAEKSRRLVRERGLRDPVRERRRYLMLVGSLAATAILLIGAIWYLNDAQERDRVLRDDVTTTEKAREFLADNTWHHWHPITGAAGEKFDRLDGERWLTARTDGSTTALQAYIADAQHNPRGNFLNEAGKMLASAEQVIPVQRSLARMRVYNGPVNGAKDRVTQDAIALFRYRWNMPVSTEIDDALTHTLDKALEWWTHPRLEELRAHSLEAPTEADYLRFAQILGIDAATIRAVMEVETGPGSGFLPDGRMKILFERHVFHQLTHGRYAESHPDVSSPTAGGYGASGDAQYNRVAEAFALDPDAALQATSWGRLQIMGMQYKSLGYGTVGEFVRFMSQNDANQLEAGFIGFIRTWGLDKPLQNRDWAGFARRYNGPNYTANGYEARLSEAYQRISAEIAAQTLPAQVKDELAIPSASASLPMAATPENRAQ